jgi:hypothetical protein
MGAAVGSAVGTAVAPHVTPQGRRCLWARPAAATAGS